jgi:hypothetical protein
VTCSLPERDAITILLRDLLGKDVSATIQKNPPKSTGSGVVATYYDDAKNLAAMAVFSIELAAGAGAALALIPAAAATTQAASGKLDEILWENLSEVLNVASRWFNGNDAIHVRFGGLHYFKDLPADAKALLTKPATRVDADVTIKGYGTGLLDLLVA